MGTVVTIALIILLALVFGVIIIGGDTDWFD